MRLTEHHVIAPPFVAADHQAGTDGDSLNMALLHSVALVLNAGAITGNATLKLYSGATAGTKTTALAFRYRPAGDTTGNASADVLGDETDVAATGLLFDSDNFKTRQAALEVEAIELTDGESWLTLELDGGASELFISGTAIGVPRYGAHQNPTVL